MDIQSFPTKILDKWSFIIDSVTPEYNVNPKPHVPSSPFTIQAVLFHPALHSDLDIPGYLFIGLTIPLVSYGSLDLGTLGCVFIFGFNSIVKASIDLIFIILSC